MFDEPTPDGLPIGKAPTVKFIFVSDEAKNRFLGMLADGALPNVEIGASESAPLFEVDDVSVVIHEVSGLTRREKDGANAPCKNCGQPYSEHKGRGKFCKNRPTAYA